MRQAILVISAVLAGVLFGWLGAAPLAFVGPWVLIAWGLVTIAIGLIPGSRVAKVLRLASWGFALGFSFMCFGYSGAEPLLSRIAPFAVIGLVCAAIAVLVGGLVHLLRSVIVRARR